MILFGQIYLFIFKQIVSLLLNWSALCLCGSMHWRVLFWLFFFSLRFLWSLEQTFPDLNWGWLVRYVIRNQMTKTTFVVCLNSSTAWLGSHFLPPSCFYFFCWNGFLGVQQKLLNFSSFLPFPLPPLFGFCEDRFGGGRGWDLGAFGWKVGLGF